MLKGSTMCVGAGTDGLIESPNAESLSRNIHRHVVDDVALQPFIWQLNLAEGFLVLEPRSATMQDVYVVDRPPAQ